ncbi:DUF4185 domain-containing protein [Dietzia sp. ANT_WB102]|uniref:DUF4185 domain-containing protein n=1 Tax=Dietzia sp. ANT_WB102 TaxID=2597345 RepID=UPI00165DAE0E|nr:DUF4185 domain-containing protein [Dietzia sp. ANT_WB102]
MNLINSVPRALAAVPLAVALAIAVAPAHSAAQSEGSLGSSGSTGSTGSTGSSGSTGSLFGESGPCNSFFGNLPPGSLGPLPATGSLANATNSVLDATASSVRRFPRWVTGANGTIPVLKGATSVRQLVTGPTSPAKTDELYDIHGTDLGITFTHQGKTMALFGDTFGDCTPNGNQWRSNVMLATSGGSPDGGMNVLRAVPADAQGKATALVQGAHQPNGVGEVTVIPTAAVSNGTDMYMRVMSVRDWNAPGGWNTNYSGLAKSTDGGNTWKLLPATMRRVTDFSGWHSSEMLAPGDLPAPDKKQWYGAQMSAFLQDGEWLYEYVTPSGRRGPAMLARVKLADIEDPTAYKWYAGPGLDWADAPTGYEVIPARVEELSVQYNKHLDKYTAMTPSPTGVVSMRVSDNPWGPWSEPQTIVDRRMFPNGYAPMIHPFTTDNDSRYLYYTLSTWDAYNVFLMRTDLDAFNFAVPDANPRTAVESRVTVKTAADAGAINDQGVIDEQRLEEIAEIEPAAAEPIVEPPGR